MRNSKQLSLLAYLKMSRYLNQVFTEACQAETYFSTKQSYFRNASFAFLFYLNIHLMNLQVSDIK